MSALKKYIDDVPNYPIEGVVFRDISPLLAEKFPETVQQVAGLFTPEEWDAGMRTLYIVPSLAAANSVYDKLRRNRPDISVGRAYDGYQEFDSDVTVIVYNSLYQHFYKSLIAADEGKQYPFNLRDYRLIVADEAHEYLTELADHIFQNSDALKLALTATDKYFEGKEVADRFQHLIHRVDLDQAYYRDEILKPKYRCIETSVDLNLDDIYHLDEKDELNSQEVEARVNVPEWNQVFVDVWRNDVDPETGHAIVGDKTFVHCASVQHAIDMADQFNEQLMPLLKTDETFRQSLRDKGIDPDKVTRIAAPMSHMLSPDRREQLMEMYDNREVLMLTSSKMLLASVDDPETGVIMNAVPTFSRVRAGQRGYRGSRTAAGKEGWYVYEALPHNWQESLYAPVLFAEAAEDPQMEGLRNRNEPHLVVEREEETAGDQNYRIRWEMTDIAGILDQLYLIRLRRRGLEALDPDWLENHDNQRGRYLEALRRRARLSRVEVAQELGVIPATIWNYERGLGFQDMKTTGPTSLGVEKFIEKLQPLYDMSPLESERLLYYFLPALDPRKFALIPDEMKPAALLNSFRLRAGVGQKEVCRALGKDETFQVTISGWERRNRNSFDKAFLDMSVSDLVGKLQPLYRMSDEEAQLLLKTLLPALNPEWLEKQPENRRAGLYLTALRRKNTPMSYEAAVEALGMEFNWEKRGNIEPSRLPIPFSELLDRLQKHYRLSDEERTRVTQLVLPALDPKKLEQMPEARRLPELLVAYRKRASLSQDTAGEKIGEIYDADKPDEDKKGSIKFGTLSSWEKSDAPPLSQNSGTKEYIGAIIRAYGLNEEEGKQFLGYAIPALSPEWLEKQPAAERTGYMLMGYRQMLGQSRPQLAGNLELDASLLARYETGERPIPQDVLDSAIGYMRPRLGPMLDEQSLRLCHENAAEEAGRIAAEREQEKKIRGDYILGLREAAGLEQKEAAERLGISVGVLANYEKGNGFSMSRHSEGSSSGVRAFVASAKEVYQLGDQQCSQLTSYLLPALDPKLQEATPLEDRLPDLLKAFRLREGLTLEQVSDKLNYSQRFKMTLGNWEGGRTKPDRVPESDISVAKFIREATPVYHLSEEEARGLMEAFFPALNKQWLSHQPESEQLGMLMKAYRLRGTTLTRNEAEKELGFSLKVEKKSTGNRIASSRLGIPLDEIVERISTLYQLSEEETRDLSGRLIQTGEEKEGSEAERQQQWKIMKSTRENKGWSLQKAAEELGLERWSTLANWERHAPPITRNSGVKEQVLNIIGTYGIPDDEKDAWIGMILPPLSKDWLQQQPESNRFGLLLMAYRQFTGKTRDELASELKTKNQALGKYESGDRAVPPEFVDSAVSYFNTHAADLFDEEPFRAAATVSNAAISEGRRRKTWTEVTQGATAEKVGEVDLEALDSDTVEEVSSKPKKRAPRTWQHP